MRDADKVIYILRMYIKLYSKKLGKFDKFVDEVEVEKMHEFDDGQNYICYLTCPLFCDIIFNAFYNKRSHVWRISSFKRGHMAFITEEFADELIRGESFRISG